MQNEKGVDPKTLPCTKKVTFVEIAPFSVISFSVKRLTAQESVFPSSQPVTSNSSICFTSRNSGSGSRLVLSVLPVTSILWRVKLTSATLEMFFPSEKLNFNNQKLKLINKTKIKPIVQLKVDFGRVLAALQKISSSFTCP